MSLLPFLLEYDFERQRRFMDQPGLGITPEDYLNHATCPMTRWDHYRPWRPSVAAARDLGCSIKSDTDKFQVRLDVQHFAPEEVSVKTADDHIIVEGKHEEKKDQHGFVSRQFSRRYAIPENCSADNIESQLSSDGVLTVTVPRKAAVIQGERLVSITQTGPVRKAMMDRANGDQAQ